MRPSIFKIDADKDLTVGKKLFELVDCGYKTSQWIDKIMRSEQVQQILIDVSLDG